MRALSFFLIFFPFFLNGDELTKQTLSEQQRALLEATSEERKSQINYALAIAYFQDQEIDQAFLHFLEALKRAEKKDLLEITPEENVYYQKALEDYLANMGKDPALVAEELLEKYREIADQNRQFVHLNFLIAMAFANLSKYDEFFCRFYRGYPYLHDSFLAYKAQGILYLRLSHHGKSAEERRYFQDEALCHLSAAHMRSPQDSSLYKVLIFLAKENNDQELVRSYLQKIVEQHVFIPRGDILLYVKEAALLNEFKIAQEMIDQARSRYEYSRALMLAEEYLLTLRN